MEGRILTKKQIADFAAYLKSEEKSENTVEKYIRDVKIFATYMNGAEITKESVITYKNKLLSENYAVRSTNSMLASINGLLSFLGWDDLKVKSIKLQRRLYCPEEKELTRMEYIRLVNTAKQKGNERLNLLIQTICGTGIRVSELQYITVEAVKCSEAVVSLKGKTRSVFIVRELQKKLLRYAAEQKISSGAIFISFAISSQKVSQSASIRSAPIAFFTNSEKTSNPPSRSICPILPRPPSPKGVTSRRRSISARISFTPPSTLSARV